MPGLEWPRCVFVFLLSAWLASAEAANYFGKVTRIRDGDTVQVTTDQGEKLEVRLQAIDAPEKGRAGRAGQPYAEQSREALRRITSDKRVTVEASTLDEFGRHVGLVTIDTGNGEIDAGLIQIQLGLAWAMPRYLSELPAELQASYRYAESIAKARNRGLWSATKPQAPWTWRESAQPKKKAKTQRKAKASTASRKPRQ